jgi:hypothetical protein
MVSFKGDKGFMYKANLSLRTALKILKPIYFFKATNESQLYKGVQGINWSKFISANQTFVIDATVHSTHFNHFFSFSAASNACPISSSDLPIPTAISTNAFDIASLLPSYMSSGVIGMPK